MSYSMDDAMDIIGIYSDEPVYAWVLCHELWVTINVRVYCRRALDRQVINKYVCNVQYLVLKDKSHTCLKLSWRICKTSGERGYTKQS